MTPNPTHAEYAGLISSSEIADFAGVQRSTVSNWRRRNPDFPAPVAGDGTGNPLFDRAQVDAWLATKGYSLNKNADETRVWASLQSLRNEGFEAEALVDMALTVATARRLSEKSPDLLPPWQRILSDAPHAGFAAQLTTAADASRHDARWGELADVQDDWLRATPAQVAALVYAIDKADFADLGNMTDRILARLNTTRGRGGFESGFVGSRTSRALANMIEFVNGPIYDPACGIGEVLLQVVDDPSNDDGRLVGHEVNVRAARTARQRFLLRGLEADIVVGDVLAEDPDPSLKAGMILLEPPLGLKWERSRNINDPRWRYGIPPASSADFAWIQHCLAHLAPGGRACVITTMGPLFRGGQEGAIRTELVRQGCVEAVVALPGRMQPGVSVPLALWLLCPPGDSTNPTVLLVDGSDVADAENHVQEWMGLEGRAPEADDPPWAAVPYTEILAQAADLSPRRWIGAKDPDDEDIRQRHHTARRELTDATAAISDYRHAETTPRAGASPARVASMRDLLAADVLTARAGRQRASEEDNPVMVITPRDVRAGLLPAPDADLRPLNETPGVETADLTRPGDLLVTTMNGIHALVDQRGGHAIGIGVHRIRVSQPDQILPEYLAAALTGTWNERFQTGATALKAELKSLEVPLLPIADQRRVVDAINALHELAKHATTLQTAAGTATQTLLEAVRFNVQLNDNGASQ